jgi:predicted enzyme related to lactoylglutathione lyase
MRLTYVLKFVADMDAATAFYRDIVGLKLKFQSPEWTEFDTGETTLALHLSSDEHPAGSCQIGFKSADLDAFYAQTVQGGMQYTKAPAQERWVKIARFLDCDGAEVSVSG